MYLVAGTMAVVAVRYADAWGRKQMLQRSGQLVRLTVAWWRDLLVIECEALPGFVHLVSNVDECINAFGKYHISVAQYPVATQEDYDTLRCAWDGASILLLVDYVPGDGCLELGDCQLVRDCRLVHDRPDAWYNDRS